MKYIAGFFLALSFLVFCGTQSFAQNYAIITIKNNSNKKYYATEFGYRKVSDDVIVYYAKPQEGRLMQGKDDLTIKTKIGTIYFNSDRMVSIDKEIPNKRVDLVRNDTSLFVNGNFVVKQKQNNNILKDTYDCIGNNINSHSISIESLTAPTLSFSKRDVIIYTKNGAIISFGDNNIIVSKGKYSVTFTYDLQTEQAYCFVN